MTAAAIVAFAGALLVLLRLPNGRTPAAEPAPPAAPAIAGQPQPVAS